MVLLLVLLMFLSYINIMFQYLLVYKCFRICISIYIYILYVTERVTYQRVAVRNLTQLGCVTHLCAHIHKFLENNQISICSFSNLTYILLKPCGNT